MTESQRKWLTGYIGECCGHDWMPSPYFEDRWQCKECKLIEGRPLPVEKIRTFDTWADLGAVKEAIQKNGEWAAFWKFAYYKWIDTGLVTFEIDHEFARWLINPSRFFSLVCAWKGVE